MNKTFVFLSLSNIVSKSPIFTVSPDFGHFKLSSSHFNKIFSNCIFSNYFSSDLKISRSKFSNFLTNSIRIQSGNPSNIAIFRNRTVFSKEFQLEIKETIFGKNKAHQWDVDGGALYVELSTVLLQKCSFIDNFVTSSAGALRIEKCLNCSIRECLFGRNTARCVGGAVVLSTIFNADITNTNFSQNTCSDAASIAFLRSDMVNPVNCIDYSSNSTNINGCAWLFDSGDFEIGACCYLKMRNPAIKVTLFASGGIFSSTFQKMDSYSILWDSRFQGTIQECIFDKEREKSINIVHFGDFFNDESLTIEQCSFGFLAKNSELEKKVVMINYNFNELSVANLSGIVTTKKINKYANTFINIQSVPSDDTFNENNQQYFIPFIIIYATSFCILQIWNYWLRTRTIPESKGNYKRLDKTSEKVPDIHKEDQENDIGILQDDETVQNEIIDNENVLEKLENIPISNNI